MYNSSWLLFQAVQTLPSREKREETTESNPLADFQRGVEASLKKLQTMIEQNSMDTNVLTALGSNITALTNKAAELAGKVATAIRNAEVQPTPAA